MILQKEQLVDLIKLKRIIPLFNHEDEKVALKILEVSYKAGIRLIEFTNRRSNAMQIFSALIKAKNDFREIKIGIGTIFESETTQKFLDVGADFIVSPILKQDMATTCNSYNALWIPGCATPTEIALAKEYGAVLIKVFPGSVLGPQFVSSIASVMPDVKLMISGGVEPNEDNLKAWFKAGAFCVGIGSQLFDAEIISANNWQLLESKIVEAIGIVNKVTT